jgi:hypothetical protein
VQVFEEVLYSQKSFFGAEETVLAPKVIAAYPFPDKLKKEALNIGERIGRMPFQAMNLLYLYT